MAFTGKILDINLSTATWKILPLPRKLTRQYLGGRGYNVQFLFHNLAAHVDPLSPENLLLFSCGLLTGTAAPSSARLHINARSPLTGILGSSNVGGGFGAQLRVLRHSKPDYSRQGTEAGLFVDRRRYDRNPQRQIPLGAGHPANRGAARKPNWAARN